MSQFTVFKKSRSISVAGFTLIELMVTIGIIGIFSSIAAPSFRDFIAGQRVKSASYDISYMLTNARSEALKRNVSVTVASSAGGWQNGWTMTAGSGSILIGQHEAFAGLSISGPTAGVIYNSSGRLSAAVDPFSVSSANGVNVSPRCTSIDLSGLPNSKSGAC